VHFMPQVYQTPVALLMKKLVGLNACLDGITLNVLTRNLLILFAAVMSAFQVPDDVGSCRQTRTT
ncbi:hypothetical protein, partial [Haliea atlantica]